MIKIEERYPKKMPGLTSLFITFNYDKALVEIIKSCSPANYDKKTQVWEIPLTRLAKFINLASKIDDIELKLLKEKKLEEKSPSTLHKHKCNLYNYQKEGVLYGLDKKDSWLLLDSPGLGKTITSITLAEELKERDNLEHCLVICGLNTLKTNWEKEIKMHSKLDCMILGKKVTSTGKITFGSISDRLKQLKSKIEEFFVIVNIESLRDDKILKELKNGINKFDMIIFDEVHASRNPNSQQGKNLLKLTNAKYKLAMTGTLLLNNPLDAYVPLKWTGNDQSTFSNFKYQYCVYGGPFGNEIIGYKNIDILQEQIESCSLRRTKDILDLPEKNIIHEYLDMSSTQETFYTNIVNGVKDQVNKVKLTVGNLLAMATRLRQATACPSILTTEDIPSVKLDRCCELVDEIISNGDKVVIFSVFKEPLNYLFSKLEKHNPLLYTGDISEEEAAKNYEMFQTDSEHKVILGTCQKMGTGLTLTAASYAIFIDTPWTDGLLEQCIDRIHRIGSKKPIFAYILHCNDTFDMRVKEIVENKEAIGNYIIDNCRDERTLSILSKLIKEL